MARLSEHGIRLSSMSPSFLNSNSTSHTWPFSAVAELIDNASDPGVSAKQIWIDVVKEDGHHCLTFTDNGSGMTPNKLHKMLSFGFTEKGSGKASQQAIGLYGNGFKSGSMRLGRDALIFTKNGGCQTVGMLSQTYLENIKAQAVIVPIVPFNQLTKSLVVTEDSEASLAAILQNSIITSQEQIHAHFDSILSKKGTKILIWNIRRAKDGKPEIDFEADESDFRLPEIQIGELRKDLRASGSLRTEQNIPEMHYSLRAYLSILYLKPRTQVILRGKKIPAQLVSKRLKHIEHDVYKPHFSKEKVKVTFGLNLKNKDHYGIMMYHKNRLIKAYEKVGFQLKTSGQRGGVGVIGVIECNFLRPAHNKQDFEYTKEYRLTLGALGLKLNDYWREMMEKKAREREFQALDRDGNGDMHDTDQAPMWVQCGECLKWRSVPAGHYTEVPDSWNCRQNPNPRYKSCSSPEEAEDDVELLTPSYQKNHKKQEHPKSRKREKSLELSVLENQAAKHQILSRSASEPSQPTFQPRHSPDLSCTDLNSDTHTHDDDGDDDDDALTHSTVTHTQQKPPERDTVIQDQAHIVLRRVPVGNERNEEEGDKEKHRELEESGENTSPISFKRKSETFDYSMRKKPFLYGDQHPSSVSTSDGTTHGGQADPPKTTPTENTNHCGDKPDDRAQGIHNGHTWTHPPPPTQTLVVSPLNLTEGPRSRPPPREGSDREANMQKLAGLEKEVQRLRRLLGLEIMKTRVETTTITNSSSENTTGRPVTAPVSREIGCQTDETESSSSSSNPVQVQGAQGPVVQSQRAPSVKSHPRQEKTERVSDSDDCEDSRSAEENLRDVRNNVVVLLTALLPQLDLAGISVETSDVDSILQQIIEVNSLKL